MDLSELRRHPDVEGLGLAASDAADRLILDEAAAHIATTDAITIVDDNHGALTQSIADAGHRGIRVHQDLLTGERALAANAERSGRTATFTSMPLTPAVVDDAKLVIMRLPRSLDRLDEVAGLVAAHADPAVTLIAGGRLKHMSTAMNGILHKHFSRVDVSHARQKSRVLIATGPAPSAPGWPRRHTHSDIGLTLVAHGGVFAGTKLDIGTRFLLDNLGPALPDAAVAADLACGNGVVGAWLAQRRPSLRVYASDRSASAVASARLTMAANDVGERVDVRHADGMEHLTDGSVDLVVLNPPFHSDAALTTGIAERLFADAARALAPGGELWCVWNSHLRYRRMLDRLVGPTRQIARNPKFTVTASRRQESA